MRFCQALLTVLHRANSRPSFTCVKTVCNTSSGKSLQGTCVNASPWLGMLTGMGLFKYEGRELYMPTLFSCLALIVVISPLTNAVHRLEHDVGVLST